MNPIPTNDPQQKKGLSGLAIAGIGCGALLLVFIVAAGLLVMKGVQKAKQFAGDFQKNPAKAGAMLVLKANPELEFVGSDDEKGEITVRDKKSGETTTMSFEDLTKGRLTIKNGKGEKITLDASDPKNGKVTVNGPNGKMTVGNASHVALPTWMPSYPGAVSQPGSVVTERPGKVSGMIMLQTSDPIAKVQEFYESKLKADGFVTEGKTLGVNGENNTALISGKHDDGKKVDAVIGTKQGKTTVMLNFEGPK